MEDTYRTGRSLHRNDANQTCDYYTLKIMIAMVAKLCYYDFESVQRHFTKFLPNCKDLSYATRLTTLKLQSLEHRRLIADLVMCYNIIHGNNCLNPQTFFKLNLSAITRGHPLRISVPLATLNVRQHFYATRVTPIWNSLPTEIVTAPSVHQFKSGLIKTDLSKFLTLPTFYGK